jgi:hypothetical protein
MYFDRRDPAGRTVFVGSDGRVTQTTDFGRAFISTWNQSLANLQFSGVPVRVFYGAMTGDPVATGHPAERTRNPDLTDVSDLRYIARRRLRFAGDAWTWEHGGNNIGARAEDPPSP